MLVSNSARVARLHYMANGFRMLTQGDHVLCAVTREPIPLDHLRYWSVSRQEPYATAAIATQAMRPDRSA